MASAFPAAEARPFRIRPLDTGATPCKVCPGRAPLFGVHDFARCCEETRGVFLPLTGVPVYYRRCSDCGLLFTDAFDDWSEQEFAAHIYNEGYAQVDADFEEVRPVSNAGLISRSFAAQKPELDVLDYGGGNGRFAAELLKAGFPAAATYDGFHPAHRVRPGRRFNLVTCFETIEHMPDPVAGAADIASFLTDDGLLILSTLVQPDDIDSQRMNWWYIGPRNGHITLFTRAALTSLWSRFGLKVISTAKPHIHLVCREPPAFARHLFGRAA